MFGQACFEPGMTKNTYGTGSFVLMNIGDECCEPVDGLLTTVAWSLGSVDAASTTYALEGAIFSTGSAVQWLRDGLEIIDDAAEIGPLAESVPDTGGVVLVPAFTGLGSPWWDPYARGADRRDHPRDRPERTSPEPRSSRWSSRPATSSTPCRPHRVTRSRRCGSTAARR